MFLDELEGAIDRVAHHPHQFPEYELGTRVLTMHRFPYRVIFREWGDSVEIVAIAHGRRRPARDRLE
jgi:plasmid stabilization system protein ParE